MPIQIFCSLSFSSGEDTPGPLGDIWGPHPRQRQDSSESEEEEEKGAGRKEAREGDSPMDLVAFANSCTLHGASHVFVEGGPGPRQALWAVAFVLALGAFLCQVGDRVAYYLSYPHVTLLDEVATTELAFPAVTLCNTNAVRLSQLSYPDLLYLAPMLGLDESDDPGVPLAPPGPEAFSGEPFNLHRFYNRSCHRLEDMLLYCSYCGGPCGPHNFSVVSGGPCLARHPNRVCHGHLLGLGLMTILPLPRLTGSPHPHPVRPASETPGQDCTLCENLETELVICCCPEAPACPVLS